MSEWSGWDLWDTVGIPRLWDRWIASGGPPLLTWFVRPPR
jgi:hypothetical protein